MDAHDPQPALVHDLTALHFVGAQDGSTLAFERHVGEFVDRMVLNSDVGIPSFITRFRRDEDWPWRGKPQPAAVDYAQGSVKEVLDAAREWLRSPP